MVVTWRRTHSRAARMAGQTIANITGKELQSPFACLRNLRQRPPKLRMRITQLFTHESVSQSMSERVRDKSCNNSVCVYVCQTFGDSVHSKSSCATTPNISCRENPEMKFNTISHQIIIPALFANTEPNNYTI